MESAMSLRARSSAFAGPLQPCSSRSSARGRAMRACPPARALAWGASSASRAFSDRPAPRTSVIRRAFGDASDPQGSEGSGQHGNNAGPDAAFCEVKVDSVRVSSGTSVVYLRVLDGQGLVLPVHIGENESNALLKEINKQRQMRPLTHDLFKNAMMAVGLRVTRIKIVDLLQNTYYARVYLGKVNAQGQVESETDVDARPSDAINLAVRFGAPMYVARRIAETASALTAESVAVTTSSGESHAEITRSVRDALSSFEDPTVMYQLQKELAIKEQRYEDAAALQAHIYHEMTHNSLLRLVVAMEAALQDQRYEEAARLRDEYRKMMASISVDNNRRV